MVVQLACICMSKTVLHGALSDSVLDIPKQASMHVFQLGLH